MTKEFDTQSATSKFFDVNTDNTQNKSKRGRPKGSTTTERNYRYNLMLDNDLNAFMHHKAWSEHKSLTQYINDLIRTDMKKFFESGGEIAPYFIELEERRTERLKGKK